MLTNHNPKTMMVASGYGTGICSLGLLGKNKQFSEVLSSTFLSSLMHHISEQKLNHFSLSTPTAPLSSYFRYESACREVNSLFALISYTYRLFCLIQHSHQVFVWSSTDEEKSDLLFKWYNVKVIPEGLEDKGDGGNLVVFVEDILGLRLRKKLLIRPHLRDSTRVVFPDPECPNSFSLIRGCGF